MNYFFGLRSIVYSLLRVWQQLIAQGYVGVCPSIGSASASSPLHSRPALLRLETCLSNIAAEWALRGIALGRKSWLFGGSDRGGQRTAFMLSHIGAATLNGIDPQAWLADVLARIADIPQNRIHELLTWNWGCTADQRKAAFTGGLCICGVYCIYDLAV